MDPSGCKGRRANIERDPVRLACALRFHDRLLHTDRSQTIAGEAQNGNLGSCRGTNRLTRKDISIGIRFQWELLPGIRCRTAGIKPPGAHLHPAFSAGAVTTAWRRQYDPRFRQIGG